MRTKSQVGQIGEDIACEYLRDKGWKILKRNEKFPWGEIDIIGRTKKDILVFVEVKTLVGNNAFSPEIHYNRSKAKKTERAAMGYANQHPELLRGERGFRVDLLTVVIKDPILSNWKKDCEINHYENVSTA